MRHGLALALAACALCRVPPAGAQHCTNAAQRAGNREQMRKAAPAPVAAIPTQTVERLDAAARGVATNDLPAVPAWMAKAVTASNDAPAILAWMARAGTASNDAPVVLAALAKAASATNGAVVVARITGKAAGTVLRAPVVRRLDGLVTVTAYSYVFAWREDTPMLFPEIAARRAASDSYFGYLERRISAACASNDLQSAGELVKQYVYEWDNVYNVRPAAHR
jgi:hypothetical protein